MTMHFSHPNLPDDFLERPNSQRVNRLLHEMQWEPHRVIRGYEIAGIAIASLSVVVEIGISMWAYLQ